MSKTKQMPEHNYPAATKMCTVYYINNYGSKCTKSTHGELSIGMACCTYHRIADLRLIKISQRKALLQITSLLL